MSVTLSDEDYATIMWALRRVACGRRALPSIRPDRKMAGQLSRDEIVVRARDACDKVGWSYDTPMLDTYIFVNGYDPMAALIPETTAEERKVARAARRQIIKKAPAF